MSKIIRLPLLWKYLLKEFFCYFGLSLSSFIAIILVLRMYDIAKFASLGAPISDVILFILYQIPYILPLAIPLSSLLATMILFQKLSSSYEITAFRSIGLSIKEIISPLTVAGLMLFLLNFYVTFELSPLCRFRSKEMIDKTTTFNPLLLFQKSKMMKLPDSFIDMASIESGKSAKDVLFFCKNHKTNHLYLIAAKNLSLKKESLVAKDMAFMTTFPSSDHQFDHLYLENQRKIAVPSLKFSNLLRKISFNLNHEYLPTKMMLVKTAMEKGSKHKSLLRAQFEMIRRLSYSLAAFTFTFLGASYSIHIGRNPRPTKMLVTILLACLAFLSFLIGKSFHRTPFIACICYFLPHLLILLSSLRAQKRINQGFEEKL